MITVQDVLDSRTTRRKVLSRPLQLAFALAFLERGLDPLLSVTAAGDREPRRIGATFSLLQAEYLALDPRELFEATLEAGFEPLRIIAYWDRIERRRGEYEWSSIEWQLDRAKAAGRHVILSYGVKAPRYPEFHVPDWLEAEVDRGSSMFDEDPRLLEHALAFQERMLALVGNDEIIDFIQPDNEGTRASIVTRTRRLSLGFVRALVQHARSRSNKPILLCVGMPIFLFEFVLQVLSGGHDDVVHYTDLADVVGFNPFSRIANRVFGVDMNFNPGPHYWPYLAWLRHRVVNSGQQAMVTELEAEPYDHGTDDWGRDSNVSPQLTNDLSGRLGRMGFGTQLAWGIEFAWWQRSAGELRYWDNLVRLVQREGGRPPG